MRNYVLGISICLGAILFSTDVNAQAAFGVKGGINVTNLNVKDPDATYDSKTGYHAGFFFRDRFSKAALQGEVMISTMKTNVTSTTWGNYEDRFTYLAIPLLAKFYIVDGLNIQLGPQFSFLLDGERKGDSRLFGSSSTDIKEYYEQSDVSVSAGAGWDFPFGLGIDLRYNIGVKDINDVASGEEAKSRVFQISVGWNFIK